VELRAGAQANPRARRRCGPSGRSAERVGGEQGRACDDVEGERHRCRALQQQSSSLVSLCAKTQNPTASVINPSALHWISILIRGDEHRPSPLLVVHICRSLCFNPLHPRTILAKSGFWEGTCASTLF
jgi:hypothetical protein